MFSTFHFIRPLWLLALIPSVVIVVLHARRQDTRRIWRGIVADHLLPYLVSDPKARRGLRPHVLLGLVLALAGLALAGPAWVREPAPFADDTAALVIALEVTPTMLAEDVQPSRLERAAQKIGELMNLRKGARTALIAYSETAHLVMPLTEDGDLIAGFAAELSPDIMPAEGDAPDRAVSLALSQLSAGGLAGSVLLVTDGVPPDAVSQIKKNREGGARVHVYGIGAGSEAVVPSGSPPAPPLDRDNIEKAAAAGGGDPVLVTPDDTDVKQLARIVETRFTPAVNPEGGERWRDFGYWVVPLIALLALWWFRPGWSIQFGRAGRLGAFALLFVFLLPAGGTPGHVTAAVDETDNTTAEEATSEPSGPFFLRHIDGPLIKLFFSPDQRAQYLFDSGEYKKAARLFTDPSRQGTAWYRAGDFEGAAAAFGRVPSPEGLFNRGNTLVLLGDYSGAIKSYESALKQRPDWPVAAENLAIARARQERMQSSEGEGGKDTHYTPDEIVFDNKAKDREDAGEEVVAGAGEEMGDAALRAMWLRRMETTPADFLRSKFAYQYAMQDENL